MRAASSGGVGAVSQQFSQYADSMTARTSGVKTMPCCLLECARALRRPIAPRLNAKTERPC